MIADSKAEAQAEGAEWSKLKAAIAAEKCSNGWIEISCFYIIFDRREIIKKELSNKEAQTKLVENMLGDVKLKLTLCQN
jgi:F-type H+-transporting ATPase subunit b